LADLDLTDGEFTNDIEEVELDEIELEIDSESKFKCTRAKFGIYSLRFSKASRFKVVLNQTFSTLTTNNFFWVEFENMKVM